jgi:hypothetical protein
VSGYLEKEEKKMNVKTMDVLECYMRTHLDEQQSASVIFDKLTPYKVNTDAHSPEQPHYGNTAQHGKLS